jgi:hypothetical protein
MRNQKAPTELARGSVRITYVAGYQRATRTNQHYLKCGTPHLSHPAQAFNSRGDDLKGYIVRILLAILVTVIFQQWYARTQECGVEQPIGPIGIAEFLFRHPEHIFGLHFAYPIHK